MDKRKEKILTKIINTMSEEGLNLTKKEIDILIKCLDNKMTTEEARNKVLNEVKKMNK